MDSAMTILLVEDDDGHAGLVQSNLRRAGIANPVIRFKHGGEVLDFLYKNETTERPSFQGPPLMLLDINMPKVGGIEVLREIKQHRATAKMPVIMLTTTDDPREVERCYSLGCSVYVTKPVEYQEFAEALRRLGLFLHIIAIPEKGGQGSMPSEAEIVGA